MEEIGREDDRVCDIELNTKEALVIRGHVL
jgi:hypothetical protein